VTTVGLPTRGASGNPGPRTLGLTGLTVYFSRWVDLLPDGSGFEGMGIAPAIEVREPAEAYAAHDPTLERGLQVLRQQVQK
jgi:C-terminal processing protease CtpA/Prc